ncbi:hypothetical protein PENTCL1PPCAC_29554, partial [Pristionchus entomophagus]
MVLRLALFLFLVPLASGGVFRFSTYEPLRSTRSVHDWHCGIGKISAGISLALSHFSEQQKITSEINVCCMEHDDLLEVDGLNRMEVDRLFCDCLSNVGTPYVKYIIQPLFCTVIRTYSTLFHRDS